MSSIKKIVSIIIALAGLFAVTVVSAQTFQLQTGDLLFQDLDCGVLCNGIAKVTYGFHDTDVSHVGMVVSIKAGKVMIIEAISKGVVETSLPTFLARSHDQYGRPRVMVGRLKPSYRKLIPVALVTAEQNLGKPYNAAFLPNHGQSYYCSQLIDEAFAKANGGQSIFHQYPMNFNDPKTGQLTLAWQQYFAALHIQPPQGKLGSNPGELSREKSIKIVHYYGQLRQVQNG